MIQRVHEYGTVRYYIYDAVIRYHGSAIMLVECSGTKKQIPRGPEALIFHTITQSHINCKVLFNSLFAVRPDTYSRTYSKTVRYRTYYRITYTVPNRCIVYPYHTIILVFIYRLVIRVPGSSVTDGVLRVQLPDDGWYTRNPSLEALQKGQNSGVGFWSSGEAQLPHLIFWTRWDLYRSC